MRKVLINIAFVFAFLFFAGAGKSYAQTYTISHYVNFSTHNQNMWGPNGSPFSIDTNISLFHIYESGSTSFGQIFSVFGGSFGAEFDLSYWLELGSTFSLHGFTTGSVDVEYPVRIDLTFPDDNTWCPGDEVTINTDYTVEPGWELETHFPSAGVMSLDLDFGMGIDLDVEVCVWSCATLNLININIPTDSIVIFEINTINGTATYPCIQNGWPAICHTTILPITWNNIGGIGLSGSITIPYIETVDYLDTSDPCHQCLYAYGDSTYLTLSLDIIQFLSFIAQFIPPPAGPAISQALGMLSGTYNLGAGITIDYNLLSASFDMASTMQQDFEFCPTIWSTFTFPTPVEYTITDPNNAGSLVSSGVSDSIPVETCMDLNYKYPCFGYPSLPIGISHSLTNDFSNHLWDSISFDFTVQAFEFWVNIPFPVLPATSIPEFCINLPCPCDTNNPPPLGPVCNCVVCSGAINTPPINPVGVDWSIHIGPLINISLPLGYIPLTWFDQTWNLAGFQDTVCPPNTMSTNCPELMIVSMQGNDVLCFGDSTGSITLTIANGVAPYTYSWSSGDTNNHSNLIDSITNVTSGWYYVTVSDVNDCEVTDSIEIFDINPPLYLTFSAVHVLCTGDSTGSATANVSGGTPGYTYQWSPMGGTGQTANNLPAGLYTCLVTDSVGCTIEDTITIQEPDSAIYITVMSTTDVNCFGGSDGAIDINVTGGTPPFTYSWSNGATTQDLNNIPAGIYTVIVTDDHFCQKIETVEIFQPDSLAIYVHDYHICYGMSADLIIDSTVGGIPPYNWLWSTGATGDSISVSPTTTTIYQVHAVDAHGCTSAVEAITLFVTPQLNIDLIPQPDSICIGDSAVITGLITGGGGPPHMLHLDNGLSGYAPLTVYPTQSGWITATVWDTCNFDFVEDSVYITVMPLPPVDISVAPADGCQPLTVNFSENSPDQGQTYYWLYGDGAAGTGKNPVHSYLGHGSFDVTITVTSDFGCINQLTEQGMVTVYPKPIAAFEPQPRIVEIIFPVIQFSNLSTTLHSSFWDFGDGTSSVLTNPEHTFPDTGTYTVSLICESQYGCRDTAETWVRVKDIYTFYAPNAFTPDGNGLNDEFMITGHNIDPFHFRMMIFDRWGKMIFETENLWEGWDGTFESGGDCPEGVYSYIVVYRDTRGLEKKVLGGVTLVR